MNNTLTANGVNHQINNPTGYSPNKIVKNYVATLSVFGRSVDQEFATERAKGFSKQAAAQNLFTRAVRAHEYPANLGKLWFALNLWSLYNAYQSLTTPGANITIDAPANIMFSGVILYCSLVALLNHVCAQIALAVIDAFGNFGQYSI